jgi:hypothetical protein
MNIPDINEINEIKYYNAFLAPRIIQTPGKTNNSAPRTSTQALSEPQYYKLFETYKPFLDLEFIIPANGTTWTDDDNERLYKIIQEHAQSGIYTGLRGSLLNQIKLPEINLAFGRLDSAKLNGADLKKANLLAADLHETKLNAADLSGADLRHVKLNYADLTGANLTNADLTKADLTGAKLMGTNLNGAYLQDTNLSCLWDGYRIEPQLTYEQICQARGLNPEWVETAQARLLEEKNAAEQRQSYR